ncbi:sulfatase family protein [Haliangium sp.]|uniref:sulfatase family protein n=1 Tax=Haliangium sp. TaxID=2663208 RepID=UPI003D099D16
MVPWRSLLDEVSRAELDLEGVFVDLGTADQHKYTLGGWGTGWGEPESAGEGTTAAPIETVSARLLGLQRRAPAWVEVRARSEREGGESLSVELDGRELGALALTETWKVHRLSVPAPVPDEAGKDATASEMSRWQLVLRRRGGGDDSGDEAVSGRVLVDWVHLATGSATAATAAAPATAPESAPATMAQAAGAPTAMRPDSVGAGLRAGPMRIGTRLRRALLAATPRSFGFYLHVPAQGRLIFDAGARTAGTEFVVRVRTVDGVTHELARIQTEAPGWREHSVELARFAGRAVRLELATRGHREPAGWGEPTVFVPPASGPEVAPASEVGAASPPGEAPVPRRPRNLVLVVLDTTRADAFAPFAPQNQVRSGIFDALAEESTVFVNSYNNENWTKPSVTTILSGLYPGTHDSRWATSSLPDDIYLLSEHLQKHGLTTAAFIGNAVVSEKFGFARGWDLFRNESDSQRANGEYLYRNAAEWLEQNDSAPFFLYVQSVDPHTPYDVPSKYSQPYFSGDYSGVIGDTFERSEQSGIDRYSLSITNHDLDWIRALYHGEVTYQDERLGYLLDKLEERGLVDDTLIVVTNDHGEELRDHGHMGHGWTLYEEMIRAPLVMRYPPLLPPGERVDAIVEHVDLAPTILDLMGLPVMPDADGVSFLPLVNKDRPGLRPRTSVSWSRNGMRSIRVGRWKLIAGESQGWLRLFDLQADPDESEDRAEEALIAGRLCEVYLGEALAEPGKLQRLSGSRARRRYHSREIELDDKTRRQLEALGYL